MGRAGFALGASESRGERVVGVCCRCTEAEASNGPSQSEPDRSAVNRLDNADLFRPFSLALRRRLEPRRRRPIKPGEDNSADELNRVVASEVSAGVAEQSDSGQGDGRLARAGSDMALEERRRS